MLSIPYDPALVLGNLVKDDLLNAVLAVSQAAAPADTAQEALNSLVLSKRSIDMTIQELTGMGIDPGVHVREQRDKCKARRTGLYVMGGLPFVYGGRYDCVRWRFMGHEPVRQSI